MYVEILYSTEILQQHQPSTLLLFYFTQNWSIALVNQILDPNSCPARWSVEGIGQNSFPKFRNSGGIIGGGLAQIRSRLRSWAVGMADFGAVIKINRLSEVGLVSANVGRFASALIEVLRLVGRQLALCLPNSELGSM
jgi:hypothetical protein